MSWEIKEKDINMRYEQVQDANACLCVCVCVCVCVCAQGHICMGQTLFDIDLKYSHVGCIIIPQGDTEKHNPTHWSLKIHTCVDFHPRNEADAPRNVSTHTHTHTHTHTLASDTHTDLYTSINTHINTGACLI